MRIIAAEHAQRETHAELQRLAGRFIVFDGPDGAGKTTIRDRVASALRDAGLAVTCCHDPGGTAVGERIRAILLRGDLDALDIRCETLLFMASRAQLVAEVIRPALAQRHVVLCDRYVSATCAYQAAAGFDAAEVLDLARHAVGDVWPDLTFILDVSREIGFERIGERCDAGQPVAESLDSMERRPSSFHEQVRARFLDLPRIYPRPVEILNATQPPEDLTAQILTTLRQKLAAR